MIAHWDEAERGRASRPHRRRVDRLGRAAGTKTVGVCRVRVDPGKWSTPLHRQTAEEEIFFVLGGSGICLLRDRRSRCGPATASSTACASCTRCVRVTKGSTCSLSARAARPRLGTCRGAGVSWLGGSWVEAGGATIRGNARPRQENRSCRRSARGRERRERRRRRGRPRRGSWRLLARRPAPSQRPNWGPPAPGEEGAPPHLHSADEEIFVVLEGAGTLELWPSPQRVRSGVAYEEKPIRAGDVISRPAWSGIAHGLRAGERGMTFLATGRATRTTSATTRARTRSTSAGWVDRPARRSGLRRRRAGLNAGEGKARLGLKGACTWDSCACYHARMFGRTLPPRRSRCRG